MQSIHVVCPALGASSFPRVYAFDNYTDPIRRELTALRDAAQAAGHGEIRLVLEPTGVYDRLLVQIARELGFDVKLVDGEDVAKMRQVIFGDFGKTDERDPRAIDAVATHGRLIKARDLPAVFRLMRGWGKIYQDAEDEIIEAKGRIHREGGRPRGTLGGPLRQQLRRLLRDPAKGPARANDALLRLKQYAASGRSSCE